MAKLKKYKEENNKKTSFKEAIKLLGLMPDDEVFVHIYGKEHPKETISVKELTATQLRKKIITIMPKHNPNADNHNHSSLLFILE